MQVIGVCAILRGLGVIRMASAFLSPLKTITTRCSSSENVACVLCHSGSCTIFLPASWLEISPQLAARTSCPLVNNSHNSHASQQRCLVDTVRCKPDVRPYTTALTYRNHK